MLSAYPGDSSGVIKKILSKELGSSDQAQQANLSQARIFLLLTFIKSHKVAQIKEDVALIQLIAKELVQGLSSNLREKSLDGLIGLAESIKYTTFLQKVLPQLISLLKAAWAPDFLLFMIKLCTIFRVWTDAGTVHC